MDKLCQCCGMPLVEEKDFGTNEDGSLNQDYCTYCFEKGAFKKNPTMKEQIEENLKYLEEFNKATNKNFDKEQARQEMLKFFPTLKRWKKIIDRFSCNVVVVLFLTRQVENRTEILLQKRWNTGYMDGMYDMTCSGHLEEGETLSEALIREAKEELGITLQEKDLKFVSIIHAANEGYLNFFYTVDNCIDTPKIVEENHCKDLQWFDLNNLPDNTITRIKGVLENINRGIFYDDSNFTFQKLNSLK